MSERTFFLLDAESPHRTAGSSHGVVPVEVRELTRAELAIGDACQVSESDAVAVELEEHGRRFERVNVFRHVAGADDWIEVWRRVS
jgi:hypothetical protein